MTSDTTDTEAVRYYLSRVEQVEDELYQHSERLEDLYQHEMAAYIGDLANTLHETRYEIAQIIIAMGKKAKGKKS